MEQHLLTGGAMAYRPRKLDPDFPNHITARVNKRERFPVHPEEAWRIFSDHLFLIHTQFEIKIHSFVMMPNHIHLIARAPSGNLPSAMSYFMRETSREFGRKSKKPGRLWGGRFHSSLIGSPVYYFNAYKYLYRNPVRAGLCQSPFDYRFSTLPALVGMDRTIIPVEEDTTLFESFESTVKWLETAPPRKVEEAVRYGLRRKRFAPPRDPESRQHIDLEDFRRP